MQDEFKAPVIMLILRGFSLYNQRQIISYMPQDSNMDWASVGLIKIKQNNVDWAWAILRLKIKKKKR